MAHAWVAGSVVAVVAGAIGFFVVARGSAFAAHAVPQAAFAGAAGAALLGLSTLVGLGVFSMGSALLIGGLGRRGRRDVATALTLAFMLGVGALFLSWSDDYASSVFGLLFGDVLGVSTGAVVATLVLGALAVALLAALYRPLLLSSVVPDIGAARGVPPRRIDLAFLAVVALVTTTAVPVVGALLMFSLMVGPPAAARSLTRRPVTAIAASSGLALLTVWVSLAASYQSNWPAGFYVGVLGAATYLIGRGAGAIGRAQV
jgi:zinc/manganese transport system permease protein